MRKIKFRGYAVEELVGSQWITDGYGVTKIKYTDGTSSVHLLTPYGDYGVEEKSVGQYTGLKDKNGTEIYEGDIVKIEFDMFFMNFGLNEHIKEHGNKYEFVGEVKYYDGAFHIDNNKDEAYDLFHEINTVEVIGRIYENPELLED